MDVEEPRRSVVPIDREEVAEELDALGLGLGANEPHGRGDHSDGDRLPFAVVGDGQEGAWISIELGEDLDLILVLHGNRCRAEGLEFADASGERVFPDVDDVDEKSASEMVPHRHPEGFEHVARRSRRMGEPVARHDDESLPRVDVSFQ